MNRLLQNYLVKLDNWIDPDTCRRAVAAVETAKWQPHTYSFGTSADAPDPQSLSGEQELDVATKGDPEISAAIMRKVAMATRFYTAAMQFPWMAAPTNHSDVRYNRYGPGQLMLEHCDHIHTLFDGNGAGEGGIPVLSCLTLLNSDYEGGELFFWQDEMIEMSVGTTIVFPSVFLFPHRVEPVRSGFRYSCISWAW
jgi:predicted 2-oxoglutarate/Fe(II)-dependent dioxygenase YbiX